MSDRPVETVGRQVRGTLHLVQTQLFNRIGEVRAAGATLRAFGLTQTADHAAALSYLDECEATGRRALNTLGWLKGAFDSDTDATA